MKNIAVIGAGYWGKNLVRNYFELGALDIGFLLGAYNDRPKNRMFQLI